MAITKRVTKHRGIKFVVRRQDKAGNWYPVRAYSSPKEAKNYDSQLKAKNVGGELVGPKPVQQLTVSEYLLKWLDHGTSKASEGWKKVQRQMIRDHIQPFIGHIRINVVRSIHIGELMSRLSREAGLSDQTCSHVYILLHKAFDDAIHYFEVLERNPVLKKVKPRVVLKEQGFMSPEESRLLLEISRAHYVGAGVWLGIFCGLRFGEIAALKVGDVDLTKRQILVRASYNQRMRRIEPYPEERRWKYIPMPEPLALYLESKLRNRQPEDFVVRGRYGGMLNAHVFGKNLIALSRKAGTKEVTSHMLRHSCTELWISQGASTEDIRRLLNHKDHSTTLRYIHRNDQRLTDLAQSFTSLSTD